MHKIMVVGCGLFGSAATRHLSERTDGVVCIGPKEPENRQDHNGVFASHYDEGRMTRVIDPVTEWAISAKNSIERYSDIENRSGIKFFSPSGYLGIGEPSSDYNARCAASGAAVGVKTSKLTAIDIRSIFPFLSVSDNADGLLETKTAGHISPRAMVKAQSKLAENAGAELVSDEVVKIYKAGSSIEIELVSGKILKGKERKLFETNKIKLDVLKSEIIVGLN